MKNIKDNNPMVSVIVPVYNAEEVVGRCINSIVSQTYRNLEIILVNDGSKDNSLEICKNYERLDRRVKVINIPNGGVSNARNTGIEKAIGTYIQFIDADDMINLEMTGHLVECMETYFADIVFCGTNVSEYDKCDNLKVVEQFTSRAMGKECVLSKKVFNEKFPKILLETVLLEACWNCLYRAEILKSNNIKFPNHISLGEDLIFNFHYYKFCEKAVFLEECYYYYVQDNTNSLTKVYRKDMFQNRIELLNTYADFMSEQKAWTEEGKVYYANYAVGYLISILKNIFSEAADMSEVEKKREIEQVLNCELFRENIAVASWTDERWRWMIDCFEYSDVGAFYRNAGLLMKDYKSNAFSAPHIHEEDGGITRNPGKLNTLIVESLKLVLKCKRIRKVELLKNSIEDVGLKQTLIKKL